jgi:hypothetical protein
MLAVVYAAFLKVALPLALLAWVVGSLAALECWLLLERRVLVYLGCREPTFRERARLESWVQRFEVDVLIADDPALWIGAGLRAIIVSRGAFESLDDAGLAGLLEHAALQRQAAGLVREGIVWLGNAPLLVAWFASRALGYLGRLLAMVIGSALVLPMLVGATQFVTWVGAFFSAVLIGLIGAALISGGAAAPGLGLLTAWALVPALRSLQAWESRQVEADAYCAMVRGGSGAQLLNGLELLWMVSSQRPAGLLGWLVRPGAALDKRMKRVSSALQDVDA